MKYVNLEEVRKMIEPHVKLCCDEAHCHYYHCLQIDDPVYDTMERMRIELHELRQLKKKIKTIVEQKDG